MQVISDNNVKLNLEGSKRNPVVNVEHLKPFTGLLANEGKNIVKIMEKRRSRNFDTKRLESWYFLMTDRQSECQLMWCLLNFVQNLNKMYK